MTFTTKPIGAPNLGLQLDAADARPVAKQQVHRNAFPHSRHRLHEPVGTAQR
jgi:hypothetical protein